MAGIIIGVSGLQRSGKTLFTYFEAEYQNRVNKIPVYTNMTVPGFTQIESLAEIPFSYEPKVLLLDEAYYFMDARNWHDNTGATIFLNTIGKQNILLLFTTISPDMIELRLRSQMNYYIFVKGDDKYIYYRIFRKADRKYNDFRIKKTPELFKNVKYDTQQVPNLVDCNLEEFAKKVKEFEKSKKATSSDVTNKKINLRKGVYDL